MILRVCIGLIRLFFFCFSLKRVTVCAHIGGERFLNNCLTDNFLKPRDFLHFPLLTNFLFWCSYLVVYHHVFVVLRVGNKLSPETCALTYDTIRCRHRAAICSSSSTKWINFLNKMNIMANSKNKLLIC